MEQKLVMASDVAKYLVEVIAKYGDLPCTLEHSNSKQDGVLLDPLVDVPIMTIFQSGSSHTEQCLVFMNRRPENDTGEIMLR